MTAIEFQFGIWCVWLIGVFVILVNAEIRRRRRIRATLSNAEYIDVVAQAIAHSYGHGPLDKMDPAYLREFRRDARAAIAAMLFVASERRK
jgi:hypothetical protein